MPPVIRDAVPADHAVLGRIGAEGGSPDGDDAYFSFVGMHGRLLVADGGKQVLGYVGTVPVGTSTMVTDLFVRRSSRGDGVGRHLLDAALRGTLDRMTFSSTHPAALALYASTGMVPRARLQTMRGNAGGGRGVQRTPWRHDRPELVKYFESIGATVCGDAVVLVGAGRADVLRLVSDDPASTWDELLATLPVGTTVDVSVLEGSAMAELAHGLGFVELDHDIVCSTSEDFFPGALRCVHRGLG